LELRPLILCEACEQAVLVAHIPEGRAMLVDPKPHGKGTIKLTAVRGGGYLAEVEAAGSHVPLFRPHFATCKAAR
jgi:hypothetical protein